MSHMKRLRKVVDNLHDLADSITDMAEAMEGIEPTPAEVPEAVPDPVPTSETPEATEAPVAEPKDPQPNSESITEPKPEETAASSPEPQPEPQPAPTPVAKKAKSKGKRKVTLEDLYAVIQPIVLEGRRPEVKALMLKYNAGKLSEVQEKDFDAFLLEANRL